MTERNLPFTRLHRQELPSERITETAYRLGTDTGWKEVRGLPAIER